MKKTKSGTTLMIATKSYLMVGTQKAMNKLPKMLVPSDRTKEPKFPKYNFPDKNYRFPVPILYATTRLLCNTPSKRAL